MSFGPQGYPDWQRQSNIDGPVALSIANQPANPTYTSPILPCGQFQGMEASVQTGVNPVQITFSWFADQAGTVLVGQRTFSLHNSTPGASQLTLRNRGPYVRMIAQRITPGVPQVTAVISFSNRLTPLDADPSEDSLVIVDNLTVPNGNVDQHFVPTWSGRAMLWATIGSGASTPGAVVQLFALNIAGTFDPIYDRTFTTLPILDEVALPLDSCLALFTNNSGAGANYFLSIVASRN